MRQAGKYLRGLLSDLPRKNCWTLAEYVGDRTPDRMQRLLERAHWNAAIAERSPDQPTVSKAVLLDGRAHSSRHERALLRLVVPVRPEAADRRVHGRARSAAEAGAKIASLAGAPSMGSPLGRP